MTASPEERVQKLARERNISPADAERLLAALGAPAPVRPGRNPFERWRGEHTLIAGGVVALAGLATSRLGVRYDGALDLHVTGGPVAVLTAVVDQLVAFPLTALVVWAVARALSSRTRLVDVAGAVGIARAPLVVIAPLVALLAPAVVAIPPAPSARLVAVALLGAVGLGAQLFALVLGVRAASGLRSGRLAAAVAGGVVAAEVLTKLVVSLAS